MVRCTFSPARAWRLAVGHASTRTLGLMSTIVLVRRLVVAALLCSSSSLAVAQSLPRFQGTVVAEWLPDGRRMRLTEPLTYFDERGLAWEAPKGAIVDGASIPQFAWSYIGGPFEGKYRLASVIHDVACDRKTRPWEAVHLAFYSAMVAAGVELSKAKLMFAAVYHFGPRWNRIVAEERVHDTQIQMYIDRALSPYPRSLRQVVRIEVEGLTAIQCPPHIACNQSNTGPTGFSSVRISIPTSPRSMTMEQFDRLRSEIASEDVSVDHIVTFPPQPR